MYLMFSVVFKEPSLHVGLVAGRQQSNQKREYHLSTQASGSREQHQQHLQSSQAASAQRTSCGLGRENLTSNTPSALDLSRIKQMKYIHIRKLYL